MKLLASLRPFHRALHGITGPLQSRSFQPDFVPRDPKVKPINYKYPGVYDPYGPRPPPSDKIMQLAERIAALTPEEQKQIAPTLRETLKLPMLKVIFAGEGSQGVGRKGARSAQARGYQRGGG